MPKGFGRSVELFALHARLSGDNPARTTPVGGCDQHHTLVEGALGQRRGEIPNEARAGIAFHIPRARPRESDRIATIYPGDNAVYVMTGPMNCAMTHAVVRPASATRTARTSVVTGLY